MLMVFLVGSTPPEYIHDLFVHHTDGIDPLLKKGEQVLMKEHHHCSFLSFNLASFISPEKEYLFFEYITHVNSWVMPVYHYRFSDAHDAIALRGPPTIVTIA